MTATAWDLAATTSVKDNTPETVAWRLRAHLQAVATHRRLPITYQKVAKGLLPAPPNTIHQVTEALEQLMAEDAAADRPFLSAMVISKARSGLPAPTARRGSDASPAMQRGRTHGCFMRSSSTRRSPFGHHRATPARVNKDAWPLIRRSPWTQGDFSSCPAAASTAGARA